MAITIHPRVGQILLCDFSQGFKEPEMVKSGRPVVVITPAMKGRGNLVTVVALSTVAPAHTMPFHMQLPKACMPQTGPFQGTDTWVKGDMVYSVGFHRLDLIRLNKRDENGRRVYFSARLSREHMREIYTCILHGLSLGAVASHLPP